MKSVLVNKAGFTLYNFQTVAEKKSHVAKEWFSRGLKLVILGSAHTCTDIAETVALTSLLNTIPIHIKKHLHPHNSKTIWNQSHDHSSAVTVHHNLLRSKAESSVLSVRGAEMQKNTNMKVVEVKTPNWRVDLSEVEPLIKVPLEYSVLLWVWSQ